MTMMTLATLMLIQRMMIIAMIIAMLMMLMVMPKTMIMMVSEKLKEEMWQRLDAEVFITLPD